MRWAVNLRRKIRERRGGSTIFEVIISVGLITFFLFFPLVLFSMNHKMNLLEDTLTTGVQMSSVQGGLTDEVANMIYLNLEAKGLLPSSSTPAQRGNVILVSNADARNGNDAALKYRDKTDNKISLEIQYPADTEVQFINGLAKMLGASQTELPFPLQAGGTAGGTKWYYRAKGYILSEKISY